MADKISDLPGAGASFLIDEDECNQSGVSRRVSNTQRMALFKANQYDQDLDTDDNVIFNNIDSTGIIKTDTINENVLNAGVTVDTVLIKDGLVDGVDVSALQTDVDGFPDELKNLTTAEITQLENIDTTTISTAQWGFVGEADQAVKTTSNVTFGTVNTGQGPNELYPMNQDVRFGASVTFATVNTGQGANELYDMDQNVKTTDGVVFTNVNTGQGANELYAMDQDVKITDTVIFAAITAATLNTGQGANKLYDMDQNVRTIDSPTFSSINTGPGVTEVHLMNQNIRTTDDVDFNSITLPTSGGTPTALNFYEEDTHTMIFDTGGGIWTALLNIDMFFTRIGKIVNMHMPSNFVGTTVAVPAADIVNSAGTVIPARFRPVVDIAICGKSIVNGVSIDEAASINISSAGFITMRKNASAPNWPGATANTGIVAGAWSWRVA